MSDGASMILMARRSAAKALGLPILARMRSFACVGVDPRLMGIGPAFAIPVALERAGLKSDDIDIYEVSRVARACLHSIINMCIAYVVERSTYIRLYGWFR